MDNKEEVQQLLDSIEKSGKRREGYARLQLIFSGAAAVLLLVFVLLLGNIIPELKEFLNHADALLASLQTVSEGLAEIDLKTVEAIDFETLNKAIKDFSEVVEPLARFFNVFN